MIGKTIKFQGVEWKVVGELPEHLIVIRNTGLYPAAPCLIPREPELKAKP